MPNGRCPACHKIPIDDESNASLRVLIAEAQNLIESQKSLDLVLVARGQAGGHLSESVLQSAESVAALSGDDADKMAEALRARRRETVALMRRIAGDA